MNHAPDAELIARVLKYVKMRLFIKKVALTTLCKILLLLVQTQINDLGIDFFNKIPSCIFDRYHYVIIVYYIPTEPHCLMNIVTLGHKGKGDISVD